MCIPWPTSKENIFLICTVEGEGKDQQEALNLQHLKCGGHSKLPI